MGEYKVDLVANEGVFRGLAKQNMLFHQCIEELCDNAIAAANPDTKPNIDIFLNEINNEPNYVSVWICDNGHGMSIQDLMDALQLGKEPTSNCRLNEHGFGLKNSLATLSGGNGEWTLWTRTKGGSNLRVKGPFSQTMTIEDGITFPSEPFLSSDYSTVINGKVKLSFLQTVQGRGAPTSNLSTLRMWLIEHLGVAYRGYLELDPATQDTSARIAISIGNDRKAVPAVRVPLANAITKYISVVLSDGRTVEIIYQYGALDEVKRDKLLYGQEKAKYYYQKNIPTQGIDIRLGKRVIATRQFETIWKTAGGKSQLDRHNQYNDFVGEVIIPELPRGVLTTVNNKTDFNLDDPNWSIIFEAINEIRPPKKIGEQTEADIKKTWMNMLRATNPEDNVTDEYSVWPAGARIDVFRKSKADNSITIYELKVGSGTPIHLYQLKMYWDGLLLAGQQPKEAVLLVEDFSTALEEMANQMNTLTPPELNGAPSLSYNFKIEKHRDKGLGKIQN